MLERFKEVTIANTAYSTKHLAALMTQIRILNVSLFCMNKVADVHIFLLQLWIVHPALMGTMTSIIVLFLCWTIRDSVKMKGIPEKHVFVTGCDSGFGNLLAQRLHRKGFIVIAACLTEKGSQELKTCTSPTLKTVILNVTNPKSIDSAVEYVTAETGNKGSIYFLTGKKKLLSKHISLLALLLYSCLSYGDPSSAIVGDRVHFFSQAIVFIYLVSSSFYFNLVI